MHNVLHLHVFYDLLGLWNLLQEVYSLGDHLLQIDWHVVVHRNVHIPDNLPLY